MSGCAATGPGEGTTGADPGVQPEPNTRQGGVQEAHAEKTHGECLQ